MIGWPIALPLIRVLLVAAASALTWLILVAAGQPTEFPPTTLSSLALIPVNVCCLLLVRYRLHREGRRVRDLIGFSRRGLPKDLLWGLLWLIVLWIPFAGAIMVVMAIRFGSDLPAALETVFVPTSVPDLPAALWLLFAVIIVITFAPLNAPAEELIFRGYAQQGMARYAPTWVAIAVPAVIFGLQHAFFAPNPDAMLVLVIAFVVWGLGSGLIVHRQRRLTPIIIAHGIVNLVTSSPALIFGLTS